MSAWGLRAGVMGRSQGLAVQPSLCRRLGGAGPVQGSQAWPGGSCAVGTREGACWDPQGQPCVWGLPLSPGALLTWAATRGPPVPRAGQPALQLCQPGMHKWPAVASAG